MGRGEEEELRAARRGYKEAARVGNHEEKARWANELGDIHKRRGEYVEALRWLRVDYDISSKHLPQKQLLPTCQSIGEVYLRLNRLKEALVYQKKHLQLAKDSDDLIEQQRASTQLGRTYHQIFTETESDHHAMRNAKKYFKLAMKLVFTLKETPPSMKSGFFLKEFIDAHNNIGMLEMDLDNYEEAEKILLQGLKICDDEEVSQHDDGRTRLHHNLGYLYTELRKWSTAKDHIERDILICKKICHLQGEAKGFINLAELHHRVQKYDDAIRCYQKALDMAKCLEDEDALVNQINQNIKTVKEAAKVLEELNKDEQKLKKLMRTTSDARGTSNERKCLLEQNTCLDGLIEKARIIFAWPKHLEFAKRKKRVASELCDKEKLSDSLLAMGESYLKLRNFSKARKWYMKSWNGQALVKINIGQILDASGDWAGALEAFEEGYRIAVQGNLLTVQMTALDNMHYSHMIRFDNVDEARKLQQDIQMLKSLLKEDALKDQQSDYCSETETEGGNLSTDILGLSASQDSDDSAKSRPSLLACVEDLDDDVPLASLGHLSKNSAKAKFKMSQLDSLGVRTNASSNHAQASSRDLSKSCDDQQHVDRKRVRVVLSDDEDDDPDEMNGSRQKLHRSSEYVTGSERENLFCGTTANKEIQDAPHSSDSKDELSASAPIYIEESTCSFKCKSPDFTVDNEADFGSSNDAGIAIASKSAPSWSKLSNVEVPDGLQQSQNGACVDLLVNNRHFVKVKVGHDLIHVDLSSCLEDGNLDIECLKVEVACTYFLQLPEQKRSKGLLPVIGCLMSSGKALGPSEVIEDIEHQPHESIWIDVVIDGWVPKRLMKLYIDSCEKLSESTNMKLLKKLYNLEVSEDEVVVSDCELQDVSVSPFLKALQAHKTLAVLDISHNLLGNETMEKIQQIFNSSTQKYGGLTLDLHCNWFGPTALFQICECSVLSARLEVLNLSENRLTDACSSYLSTILENCKALYSLNIEQCSVTSRTVQKVADAISVGSVLSHLSIGRNNPISGNAIVNLLTKLQSLKRFSELSLTGIRLNKAVIDHLCLVAQSSSLTALKLGGTYIRVDGAIRVIEAGCTGPQELVRLDLSYCGLTSHSFAKACRGFVLLSGILEMNITGNSINQEGRDALASVLMDPKCSLRSLVLGNCQLGLVGMVQIIQALAENESLEELHLAENADAQEIIPLKSDDGGLEVADSEDEAIMEEQPLLCGPDASCASSCRRRSSACGQPIQELSAAITSARNLQMLNLSRNKFSQEAIDSLYAAWSSPLRCNDGKSRKHVNMDVVHFSVNGKKCCGVRPCCIRDW
ncbi:TPR [Musa troglodytarum]|uniref:Protein TONSOKU n=1 Tax=Musa troglodytarum TaxID=320322 RepID=A0A9E7K5N9_9LILI|nr:TPR [Musa troglodytarum]